MMSEQRGVTVNESVSLGYKRVEKFWSDDEILELFPDDDGSLVNPLLRRAQATEAELATLTAERNELQKSLATANEAIDSLHAEADEQHQRHERRCEMITAKLTAERDAAKRQLAIAIGCLDAMRREKYYEWCIDNEVDTRNHSYYCCDAAARCLELIAADAAREDV